MLSTMNLTTQAYQIILKRIINTTYFPGQRLSEKDIVEELNIGRTPVREAILRLRQEGLIETVPQSGTYIAKIDLQFATSARFVRESIETRIISDAAIKNDELAITKLETLLANQKLFSKTKQYENFFAADESFHKEFYIMTNHRQVWDWLQTINIQLNRFRMLRLKTMELPWNNLIKEHEQILNSVKNHDSHEASRLIANHLHLMLDEEAILLDSFPDYFINISDHKTNEHY